MSSNNGAATVMPATGIKGTPEQVQAFVDAKLLVMEKCPYVLKEEGKGLGYKFASERAMLESLHPVMREAGLTIAPVKAEIVMYEQITTTQNKKMNRVIVSVRYKMRHRLGGYEYVAALGEAADTGDKATAKAMTIAFKYVLRQSFMIETGDDPDRVSSDTMERAPDKNEKKSENDERLDKLFNTLKERFREAKTLNELKGYWVQVDAEKGFSNDEYKALDELYMQREQQLCRPTPGK